MRTESQPAVRDHFAGNRISKDRIPEDRFPNGDADEMRRLQAMPAVSGGVGEDRIAPAAGDALLLVDMQKDFLPGGALAVAGGDEIIPVLNRYLARFTALGLPVIATRDWHPADHCSFTAQGGPWPVHCVAGSPGAGFAEGLRLPASARIVSKATGSGQEAYSGFSGTDLDRYLRDQGVRRLFVGGLATDYCVLHTVKDALSLRYRVILLRDAMRAVDLRPGDGTRAEAGMRSAGALAADLWAVGA